MVMRIGRRTLIGGAAALSTLRAGSIRAQTGNTVKIGITFPLSASQAGVGQPELVGAQIARDQINAQGGILGKQIELVVLDDRAEPQQAIANVREHASNGINLIVGPSLTSSMTGVLPILADNKVVVMGPTEPDERLTHSLFNHHYFNIFDTNYVRHNAYAKAMAERYPEVTTWTGVIFEQAVGHDNWAAASKALPYWYEKIAHKKITLIDPLYCKLGTTDFKEQISQLLSSPAQGLLTVESGADGVTFYQQMLQFGLEKKMKVFVDVAIDISLGIALKNKVPTNAWISSVWYYDAAKNSESQKLAAEYTKRTGKVPHAFAGMTHIAINLYAEAIKNAGGTDTEKVISALEGMHLNSVKGPGYLRKEDHQFIGDTYLFSLKPKEGDPGFETNDSISVHMADVIYPPAPGTVWTY